MTNNTATSHYQQTEYEKTAKNQKNVDNLLISEKIETAVGKHPFQAWFGNTIFEQLNNDTISVISPNSFVSHFVEDKYSTVIRNTIYEITGKEWNLSFCVTAMPEDIKIIRSISHEITKVNTIRQTPSDAQLIPAFTFDNFIVGSNNQFACTSAQAVAEAPGRTNFNPLFIYGKTGLGKTHLLQAIGNFALKEETAERVLYTTGNQFLMEYMTYLKETRKSQDFMKRYRNIDILLIDDIQFLSGNKIETQKQFFFIFEALTAQRKQIVITSDRHPDEIKDMKQSLLNRFSGGLLVDIQPPNFETKIAILKRKSSQNGVDLPPDVLETIANFPTHNVRELDGLLIKVIAYSNFTGHTITADLIRQVLGDAVNNLKGSVSIDTILTETAREFDISKNKLCALSRAREVAIPRQICMYLAKIHTQNSLATIGVTFNRNHSTVLHSIKKCEEMAVNGDPLCEKIRNIEKRLGKG
ncbi:MAG: chromosomal replication initiator protein DnaA [Fibrobacteres bacterium]|nr:chromosomal replication initiator protein DnaA [Fibrobacterota bacterium]